MKKTVFLLFFVLIISSIAVTDEHSGNLIVKVISNKGQILPGAEVVISSPLLNEKKVKLTDSKGWVVFRNLPEGIYKIEVSFLDEGEPKIIPDIKIVSKKTKIIEKIINPEDFKVHECYHGTGPLVSLSEEELAEYRRINDQLEYFIYINHRPNDNKHFTINNLSISKPYIRSRPGNLIVDVYTGDGQSLPGAVVTIQSDVLMGTRSQQTGSNGRTVFRNLPPGDFLIEISMYGFQTIRVGGISVQSSRTTITVEPLQLPKIIDPRDSTCVIGKEPMIDVTRSALIHEYDMNTVWHLP